jgi:hypothetical protein
MKTLKERIADISSHLQSLMAPNVFPEVQKAVEKKDKTLLIKACRIAKIPEIYVSSLVSILLSVGPNQKYPPVL